MHSFANWQARHIGKEEFLKIDEGGKKIYSPKTPEAIKLIRQLIKEKNFDENEVKKELEDRLKEMEKGPKMIGPMSKIKIFALTNINDLCEEGQRLKFFRKSDVELIKKECVYSNK